MRAFHLLTWATLGILGAGVGLAASAQAPTQEPPAFGIDVWVRDAQGQPVSTLAPADFVVQVDGQQRRVTAARFVSYAAEAVPTPSATTPSQPPSGRTIAVVVDDLSFAGQEAAPVGEAAARWITQLHHLDRVAVVRATTAGVAAGDRSDAAARVRAATAAGVATTGTESEFLRDRRTLDQAEALASAISWLAGAPGPRVLVVLSKGMPMPLAAAQYLASSFRVARDAGIAAYVVAPATASAGAGWNAVQSDGAPAVAAGAGPEQLTASLSGRLLRATGTGEAAVSELERAVSGVYRVEVTSPSGVLPRLVPVTVSVRPAGLAVRTGALAMPPPAMSAPRTIADRTRDILAGVEAANELDFDAVASLSRDGATPGQLLLTVSVSFPPDVPSPLRISFGVLDAGGTLRTGSIDVPEAAAGPRRTAVAIAVAPGWHRLTLVAEDGRERLGSRTRAVHGQLRAVGSYAVADPRVVWRADTEIWQVLGDEPLPEAAVVAASVFEIYPAAPGGEPPPALPLRLEDATGGEVGTTMLTPSPLGQGFRLSSEVRLDVLAPGEYLFKLDTSLLDPAAAPLTLRFRKSGAATAVVAAAAPAAPPPNPADLVNLFRAGVRDNWPRYAAEDFLIPDLLMPQLKALSGARALPAALVTATGDAWWTALRALAKQGTASGLAARGLVALRDGDARAAQTHLRDAMASSPSSIPARRLLGIAYAAAGRDDGAAGTWSGAIVARTDDPRWGLAFAEVLGRVGDYKAALTTLRQIPGQPSGRRVERLVEALLVSGFTDEAQTMLVAWEAGEGREQPGARLTFYLVALRYAAALQPGADASVISSFRSLAERYVSAGGEYADLVAPWIQSAATIGAR